MPERLFWGRLRGRRFGEFKFRRQVAIGRFIADSCCPEVKLIIELDGHSYDSTAAYDLDRERTLKAMGFSIVRFSNDEVVKSIASVLGGIENALVVLSRPNRLPSPQPSPLGRGGERDYRE